MLFNKLFVITVLSARVAPKSAILVAISLIPLIALFNSPEFLTDFNNVDAAAILFDKSAFCDNVVNISFLI